MRQEVRGCIMDIVNNTNSARGGGGGRIEKENLVYLDLNMEVTKSEFSEVERTVKFLDMENMEEYCKYSILKIADAHYYKM